MLLPVHLNTLPPLKVLAKELLAESDELCEYAVYILGMCVLTALSHI